MRTTVIPAQITTVEDKIAGNLSFTQLLLLMVPVFVTAGIFISMPPKMSLSWLKVAITALITLVSLLLALRIKGKVVVEWLVIYLRYISRPKYYVFDKNGTFGREVMLAGEVISTPAHKTVRAKHQTDAPSLDIPKLVELEQLMKNPKMNITFSPSGRGGLNVAVAKVRD